MDRLMRRGIQNTGEKKAIPSGRFGGQESALNIVDGVRQEIRPPQVIVDVAVDVSHGRFGRVGRVGRVSSRRL